MLRLAYGELREGAFAMEKKKTTIVMPIMNTITAVLFALATVFSVLAFVEGQENAIWSAAIYGFCAVLNLITAVLNWKQYRKDKACAEREEQQN